MTIDNPNNPNSPNEEYREERQSGDYVEQRRIVNTGATTMDQQVVDNRAAARYNTILKVSQLVWLLFGILEGLIAIRVLLKLIASNPDSVFTSLVYGITDLFLWPFFGVTVAPSVRGFTLDIPAIIGMIVYLLIAWVIVRLIWLLFYRPNTRSVQTIRRDRY